MPGRHDVAFDGILSEYVTYLIDGVTITYDANQAGGSAAVGRAVMVSGNRTVALADDNARIKGKLIKVERDGKATVQVAGYMNLPGGTGATLTPGAAVVGALGSGNARGYVKAADAATLAQVAAARGQIVDSSDPANVWIELL